MRNLLKQKLKIPARNKNAGFTLVEILIALLIASIVISVAFELYITQHNQLLVQEDVSDIQANARAAAEMLAKEIRKTGYLLPSIVTPIDGMDSDPDTMVIRYATPALAGIVLQQNMADQYADLCCMGNNLDALTAGDWVYIYDEAADTGEVLMASEIDYHSNIIRHNLGPLGKAYPMGSKLFAVEKNMFFVNRADTAHPNLMIQRIGQAPEVFAENIESLDFTYYYEDGTSSNVLTNPTLVRMIGINVVAKSFRPELNSVNGESRKRDFTLKVKLRNFGLSDS
jgi:prepilin-type N-terminal cleavage/methylation domain-containing protein